MQTSDITGLTVREAARLLRSEGLNELPSARPRSIIASILDVVREPMFLLLLACAAIYLFLGDFHESLLLVGAVIVVLILTFVQQRKTERALAALRDLSSPRALVIRDGERRRVAGQEVVPGDIVVLSEGDRVPADGIVISGSSLAIDESLLTGESAAVTKSEGTETDPMERPGGDDRPFVFSGSLVVRGRGLTLVKATGAKTEIGRIGKSLQTIQQTPSVLERGTRRLVQFFGILGMSMCVVVAVAYALTRGDWLKGLLAGLTLAISMVPEEFPFILTIFLAMGAWRIAKQNVLTRRIPAIETLGAATVLCVDKTGTLTENRMSVQKICVEGRNYAVADGSEDQLPEAGYELIQYAVLASQQDPFDPMERAIRRLAERIPAESGEQRRDWTLVRQYALSPDLLAMSHAWKPPGEANHIVAAKGAPEAIAALCRYNPEEARALQLQTSSLAEQGLRVIAVAKRIHNEDQLPDAQEEFAYTFLGLIGLADPVRSTVLPALKECSRAGVRVIMITGDHPETASSIARQIGLESPEGVMTGADLADMTEDDLRRRVQAANIFARVLPEQKLRLVNALKANGEIVAMTGDGVNDAPALKASHIGIAMGQRGTDVAREAADLVLLGDDFASIVHAIRLGRRIHANLKNAMSFAMTVHVPIAGLSLLPVLFGWPLMLLPIHIVFLEMIIDPACATVFEAEPPDRDVMNRPPRDPNEPLFTRRAVGLSLLQGAVVLVTVFAVLAGALVLGLEERDARTVSFTTLVFGIVGLILVNLSTSRSLLATLRAPNRALRWILFGVSASLVSVLYLPFLRDLFGFAFLHSTDLLVCLGAGILSAGILEMIKITQRDKGKQHRRIHPAALGR